MPVTFSPLRYPGGKSKLTPYVIETLRTNYLFDGAYAEPFAGGAGVAWHLLLKGYVQDIYLNDLDPSIYAFWYSVLNHNAELCKLIENTPISINEWHKQKTIQSLGNESLLKLGFSTLFLNRTNRSGIIKAGVIGGKAQSGEYKLDCRFNKSAIIKKIQDIFLFKEEIHLFNLDGINFIDNVLPQVKQKILINIDPPYYDKGKGLYQNYFKHNDHLDLYNSIKKCKQPWMVTYDNVPEITACYAKHNPKTFEINYSAQIKRMGSEVIIHSKNLIPCDYMPGMSFKDIEKAKKYKQAA